MEDTVLQRRLVALVRARYPLMQINVCSIILRPTSTRERQVLLTFQAKREPDVHVWVKIPYELLKSTEVEVNYRVVEEHVLMAIYDRLDDEDKEDE